MNHRPLILTLFAAAPAFAGEESEKAAAQILEAKLKNERPEDLALLKSVAGKDIIVVAGSMDHIEQVLSAANIRHTVVQPGQVSHLDLNADQIVMVNCPGTMPNAGVQKIEKFVRAGGLLYTTDWSLLNLVQKAFPRTIVHNGQSTGDHVTGVSVKHEHDDLMSNMLLRKGKEPEWWLEGGSYPIRIVDKQKVEVLAESSEMKKKYGAAPVVVRFKWDDGEVIHVVSHFYRQIATRGPAVAAKDAIDEVQGLSPEQKATVKASPAGAVKMGDVESSYAFQRMTSNLVTTKKKKNVDLDKSYGWTPKQSVNIGGRTAQKGDRVKVLSREGKKVRVRDDRGNEAVLDDAVLEAR